MNQLKKLIEKLKKFIKDRRLFFRFIGYIAFSLIGVGLLYSFHYFLLLCYFDGLSEFLTANPIFKSTLSILILTFPLVTYNWYLKNEDTLKQFEIANRQQAETLFSNAVRQLLEGSSPIVKSVGLKELIRLKHNKSIESDRISLITSSGIDLEKAKLWGVNLQGENLQSTDLRDANIQEANLQGAHLQNADLLGANLQGVNLQGADLQGAILQSAGLRRANLQGANLQGADFQGADLQGSNLQGSNLQGAHLNRAIYNTEAIDGRGSYTEFPEGFDPVEAGMILKND